MAHNHCNYKTFDTTKAMVFGFVVTATAILWLLVLIVRGDSRGIAG